jgi:transposase InsO family protein
MTTVYEVLDCSKQAVSQYRHRQRTETRQARAMQVFTDLLPEITKIRKLNVGMGCRTMYTALKPAGIGRDVFERLGFAHGLRVRRKRSVIRTTYSDRSVARINMIAGMEVTGVNQVWQADITYVFWRGKVRYLSVIMDVYSRMIVGYSLSSTMHADHTAEALLAALVARGCPSRSYLVIHTDPGSQYIATCFRDILDQYLMYHSYASDAMENAYVERVHATLKYDYFPAIEASTDAEFAAGVARAIADYNRNRPHSRLAGHRSPAAFEAWVSDQPESERPVEKIFDYKEAKRKTEVVDEEKKASRVESPLQRNPEKGKEHRAINQEKTTVKTRNTRTRRTTGLH